MEGFRSPGGLPPLELEDSIRAVSKSCDSPQKEVSRALGRILRTPLHRTGALLHQQPGSTIAETTHDVTLPCDLVCSLRICGVRVGIVGDDVTQGCPLAVIEKREGPHEVRRDWPVRIATNHLSFTFHLGTQSVVTKATPIQHLPGVVEGGHCTRRLDFLDVPVGLGPKCSSPGLIDRLNIPVFLHEPASKCRSGLVIEALRRMTGVFVRNMPHDDTGVVAKTARHGLG